MSCCQKWAEAAVTHSSNRREPGWRTGPPEGQGQMGAGWSSRMTITMMIKHEEDGDEKYVDGD